MKTGIFHFRLEFVHQGGDDVEKITNAFASYFENKDSNKLKSQLKTFTDQGISEGSLYVPKDFKQLVQLGD